MARRSDDPMSGLLSSVGGIDSALFQRPQSLKDMKVQQPGTRPPLAVGPTRTAPEQSKPTYVSPPTASRPGPAAAKPREQPSSLTGSADIEFGDIRALGGASTKQSRPMRAAVPSAPSSQAAGASRPPGVSSVASSSSRPAAAPAVRQPEAHNYGDLDNIFGTPAPGATGQGSAGGDPFDLFGGLGTTEVQQQARAQPAASAGADLLEGFRDAMPSPGTSTAHEHSSPLEPVQAPADAPISPSSTSGSSWGNLTGASSPTAAATAHQPAKRRSAVGSPSRAPERTPSAASGWDGDSPEPPPPSYDAATRDSKPAARPLGGGAKSPRGIRSPRSSAASRYRIFDEDDEDEGGYGDDSSRARAPQRSNGEARSAAHRASRQAAREAERPPWGAAEAETAKDQAKQWLSMGQKWLNTAGKKIVAAAKETQTTIAAKLEEMEGRAPTSPPGGASGGGQAGRREPGARPQADVPAYYYEWAASIQALPEDQQAGTMAAMTDEDRLIVDSILADAARQKASSTSSGRARQAVLNSQGSGPPASSAERRPERRPEAEAGRRRPSRDAEPRPSAERRRAAKPAPLQSSAEAAAPKAASRPVPAPQPDADFLGFTEASAPSPDSRPAAEGGLLNFGDASPPEASDFSNPVAGAPGARQGEEETLFKLGEESGRGPKKGASARSASTSLDEIFGQQQPPSAPSQVSASLDDFFGGKSTSARSAADTGGPMIGFGDEAASTRFANLYAQRASEAGAADEPQIRKLLRERRLAEMHGRMQAQLAEKHARDEAEEVMKEAQAELRARHGARLDAWRAGKKDNIRALLATLHTVLWEGSGWQPLGMTDLVDPSRVKRSYMRANLIVHPDKVKQRGGNVEQIVIADIAFDSLKFAWGKFEAGELRGGSQSASRPVIF